MADVRALLKAKRQEAPVSHPLASYSSDGRLRCVVCAIMIKHASAWEGHLGSKQHRTSVARVKEQERQQLLLQQQQQQAQAAAAASSSSSSSSAKRKSPQEEEDENDSDTAPKKPRLEAEAQQQSNSSLPADFFSDPSRAPVLGGDDDDDEDEDANGPTAQSSVPPASSTATAEPSVIDKEWELFQQTVVNAPDAVETFERATIFAEPVLNDSAMEGFPAQGANTDDIIAGQPTSEMPSTTDDEEERKRKQKEQDERELIMDRLLEEERAQEDADMKVASMKARLEALRKKRQNTKTKS